MEQIDVDILKSGDLVKSLEVLQNFVIKHANSFDFSVIQSQSSIIWNAIFQILKLSPIDGDAEVLNIYPSCLAAIRILSRDKFLLSRTITIEQFDTLLNIANIGSANANIPNSKIAVESLKCLCNLVFQNTGCQMMCLRNAAIDGIFRRLRSYKDADIPFELQFYDMKLLFLITALNVDVRTRVRDDYHGLTYLVEILDLIIKERAEIKDGKVMLNDSQVDLLNEIMRILFNITVRNESSVATEEEEEIQFRRIAIVLHDLLLCTANSASKQTELLSNAINLLTNVPTACYSELIIPMHSEQEASSSAAILSHEKIFEKYDLTAVDIILEFLQKRLENDKNSSSQRELLSPVLTALVKCARCNSVQRRYLKQLVLPPLVDVTKRPEVGTELRNRLVKLLTSPDLQVRDLAADFLFVLCKENVARMIKYTGYGNAAGLFANRGLLSMRNPNSYSGDYSSDNSAESDTEEYKEKRNFINPVTGCYEPPRANPMAAMSEEQKEYEAMKLVELMDQLNRQGLVKPCKINADGRPEPVEHILELKDAIQNQQMDCENEDD